MTIHFRAKNKNNICMSISFGLLIVTGGHSGQGYATHASRETCGFPCNVKLAGFIFVFIANLSVIIHNNIEPSY